MIVQSKELKIIIPIKRSFSITCKLITFFKLPFSASPEAWEMDRRSLPATAVPLFGPQKTPLLPDRLNLISAPK